jgi:Flp pilus assembly protein TadG
MPLTTTTHRWGHPEGRRGSTTLLALLALVLLVALLAVVFDLGRISLARKQLQSLGDAAALAGAAELQDDSVLYPGSADTREIRQLISAPASAAGQRALLMAQAALEERVLVDQTTLPRGSVRCGIVNARQEFVPLDDEEGCNTVEVRIGFTAAYKNQLPLAVTRWLGARAADVETQSIATIDGRLVGFQVVGNSPAPLVPLVVEQNDDSGWWQQATTPTTTAFNDRWQRSEDGTFVPGSDGIPELLFRFGRKDDASASTAWAAAIGGSTAEDALRQTRYGLNAADLAGYGGRLEVASDQPTYLQPLALGTSTKEAMVECLQAIAGEPRVWLLGGKDPQQGLQVTGFAAGQLVQCWDEGAAGVVVLVQPCLMQTSTAIVSDDAPQNPWIAKISLAH